MKEMDDAGVYQLSSELALVNTVDFITPPVDDPYWFGAIAAANSLSDVYCMNGLPITAMNLVMFPSKKLDLGVLREILAGGFEKIREAGASLVGGHSIVDDEPKYGLSVSGTVHPQKIWKNSTAQVGDALILTKPLGSGVLFNAVRAGKYPYATLLAEVLPVLGRLNASAREAAQGLEVHACTDVTGFGILGHSWEMAKGCGASLVLQYKSLPYFGGVKEMYQKGQTTGSNKANRLLTLPDLVVTCALSAAEQEMIYDPQTSGGLLFALPQGQAGELLRRLNSQGWGQACQVGQVVDQGPLLTLQ